MSTAAHDEEMHLYGILDMLDNWDEFDPPTAAEIAEGATANDAFGEAGRDDDTEG